MNIKYILFIACVACLSHACKNLTEEQKNADALYYKLERTYQLNTDGSWDFYYAHRLDIKSYLAFHRLYGESFIMYNPQYQQLIIDSAQCYTLMVDGKKVKVPENAFNEVLPRFAKGFPSQNHLREMVVSHTGLEVGAKVFFRYQIHTVKDFYPYFMGKEEFHRSSPVKESDLVIKVPEREKLHYTLLNTGQKPEIRKEDGMVIYRWHMENLPGTKHESIQGTSQIPSVLFHTAKGGDTLTYIKKVSDNASLIDDQMRTHVSRLNYWKRYPVKHVLKIQEIVVNELNTFDAPIQYNGFRIRYLIKVWESNGGTPWEKCMVLSAMLNDAGYTSEVIAGYDPAEGFSLLNINDFKVKVSGVEGNTLVLSAETLHPENLYYSPEGKTYISLGEGVAPVPSKKISRENTSEILCKGKMSLNEQWGLSGKMNYTISGKFNDYLQAQRDYLHFKNHFEGIKYGKVLEASDSVSVYEYYLEEKEPFTVQANYLFWDIPTAKNGFDQWGIHALHTSRGTPMELPVAVKEHYQYEVKIPPTYSLVSPGEGISLTNDAGEIKLSVLKTDGVLTIERLLLIPKRVISPENYHDFRELINAWNDENYRQVILKKEEKNKGM